MSALSEEERNHLYNRKLQTRVENEHYLRAHPEMSDMIHSFYVNLLEDRPRNPVDYAFSFFTSPELRKIVTGKDAPVETKSEVEEEKEAEVQEKEVEKFGSFDAIVGRQVTFIVGPLGCGKKSLGDKIASATKRVHVSSGMAAVNYSKANNDELPPPEVMASSVCQQLLQAINDGAKSIVVTGFPNTKAEWDAYKERVNDADANSELIYMQCDDEKAAARVVDDGVSVPVLRRRYANFEQKSGEVLRHFREINSLKFIDADLEPEVSFQSAWSIIVKPKLVFVVGGPGAGKSTLCKQLASSYGLSVVSVGDVLRKEAESGNEEVKAKVAAGDPVPTHTAVICLAKALSEAHKSAGEQREEGWIIDNFPLTLEQAIDAGRYLSDPSLVLFLDADSDLLSQRLHHASEDSKTIDSAPQVLDSRMDTFVDTILPVVEHFDKKGLVKAVNAAQTAEAVLHEAKAVIREVGVISRPPS
eukprot:CAMPEP_0113919014 /NCGR_PEP_ID=MMETSP0780_2-20120614/33684_1 /TAXON_ID=652834 /ORGANISM="Palpitomonas bilix" /LENGTH=472 /DNA_ID=CAMNT_0000918911 /DNA_START=268 /DNA_END=1682 /DNA_ORIENTATION=+ /assembly_acc=CAM_ASM_000599